jgi:predicted SprT family Zn-dependent metalloprotease
MQGSDGNFYGTTTAGGAHYQGTNLQPFVYRCACALEIALKRRAKLRDASLTCRLCKALGICMIRAPLNQ